MKKPHLERLKKRALKQKQSKLALKRQQLKIKLDKLK